ncbi:hypothetical protein [Hydrogenophaga crassostreae]|nr:hypothetical protein [Hydrogenophaga crassostreae]
MPKTLKSGASFAPLALLTLGVVAFILKSYPMMRPGFDVWWHLGMIEAPQLANPGAFPTSRILWHHFWHHVLDALAIADIFDRALFIHRSQLFATVALVTLSAYLTLRSVLHRFELPKTDILLSALLATVAWFLMSGTASTARDGGPDAFFVQSWSVWYSLNYQISLPFYLAGTACILYAITAADTRFWKVTAAANGGAFIVTCTLAHAAETAYFLVCILLMGLIFIRGKSAIRFLTILLPALIFSVWASLQQSYVRPEIIDLAFSGDWASLHEKIDYFGSILVNDKLNRIDTGWTAMHSLCFISLTTIFLFSVFRKTGPYPAPNLDRRALVFVTATSLMPLALFFSLSAGLLAMTTHLYIAWRFSLASFLFVGLSLPVLLYVHQSGIRSVAIRQWTIATMTLALIFSGVALSYQIDRLQPSYRYLSSLKSSLDEEKSYFGLRPKQQEELSALAESLRQHNTSAPLCTDIFTAYYLFFVERYHHVALPQALEYLPGYEVDTMGCNFAPTRTSIQGLREPVQH